MDNVSNNGNGIFCAILTNALKIPGVKVDREEFLDKILTDKIKDRATIYRAIETTPIEAGIKIDEIDKIAKYIISRRTADMTLTSFATGIPGVIAMAATVPLDAVAFFGSVIKLSQQLAYLYGYKDFWNSSDQES